VKSAVTFSAPIVKQFDKPINYVDQTIVKGIEKLEASAPIIKEQPGEIINQAKTKVFDVVQPRIERVCELRKAGEQKAASLKELSYNKANEVLATHYGSLAVSGVDSTAALAERLLDSFLPKNQEDEAEDDDSKLNIFFKSSQSITKAIIYELLIFVLILEPISATEDPALHTVQTIGALSNKVARRVYRTVSRQLKVLKKEDLVDYLASLVAVLRLTQILSYLNHQQQQPPQPQQKPQSQEVVKAKVDAK
jgi:perilipin-2